MWLSWKKSGLANTKPSLVLCKLGTVAPTCDINIQLEFDSQHSHKKMEQN